MGEEEGLRAIGAVRALKLRPLVDSVHALGGDGEGCRAAYARLRSRRARGKVVVDVLRAEERA